MAARGGLSGVHNFFIYRERRMPQNPPHWRKPARTHQTLTRHTSGQPKWPKPVYHKHFSPDQDSERKKPLKNVAREDTPSINLQRKCASQRESCIYIYIYIRARSAQTPPDTPLSGSLLRLLCHHVHMLANLTVCRDVNSLK